MSKGNKGEILCTIKGSEENFDIRKNTIYVVKGRSDSQAPDGLQRLGISKIPFSGNGDRILCKFDNFSFVYDTGFYSSSRCYKHLSREDAVAAAKQAYENVGRPYAEISNKDITQSNFEFWDNFVVSIDDESNNVFDTGNPVDVFRLYIAVRSYKLMPEELDGDPRYADAYYKVIDSSYKTTFDNEYELNMMDATAKFVGLLNGGEDEYQAAKDIAIYLGFYDGSDVNKQYLMLAFNNYLKAEVVNLKTFSKVYTMYENPKDYEVLKVCRMLAILTQRGRAETSKKGLVLDGRVLGKERKIVADVVVTNPKKAEDKIFIVDAYHSLFLGEDDISVGGKKKKEEKE